jgi:hypothetical protein
MTPDGFRKLALALPGASEGEHMDHPDFRVRGKIFATIKPDPAWAVVMLTPDQQKKFVGAAPGTFVSVPGGWGRKGATQILLKSVRPSAARDALVVAWRNRAGDEPPLIRKSRGRA